MQRIVATCGFVVTLLLVVSASAVTFPSDSTWYPLTSAGQTLGDVDTDGAGNGREIIGCIDGALDPTDATQPTPCCPSGDADFDNVCDSPLGMDLPAVYVYHDGSHFMVRLRLNDTPEGSLGNLNPFGWGLLIDTDGNYDDYEFQLLVNGIGGADDIEFSANTIQTMVGDPSDKAEVFLNDKFENTQLGSCPLAYNGTPCNFVGDPQCAFGDGVDDLWEDEEVGGCGVNNGNGRVSLACDSFSSLCFGGTDDFFLDFAIPLSYFSDYALISANAPLTFWAGTG